MNLPDSDKWTDSINEEIDTLVKNETFEEVTEPPSWWKKGRRPMGARWVFKRKSKPDDSTRYKSRLVVKGYEQRFGIHYTETYAPVVNLRTIRTLMATAAH